MKNIKVIASLILFFIGVAAFWLGFLPGYASTECCGELYYTKRHVYTYLVCAGFLGVIWLNIVFPISTKLFSNEGSKKKWVLVNLLLVYVLGTIASVTVFFIGNSNQDYIMKAQLSLLMSIGFAAYLCAILVPVSVVWAFINKKSHNQNKHRKI